MLEAFDTERRNVDEVELVPLAHHMIDFCPNNNRLSFSKPLFKMCKTVTIPQLRCRGSLNCQTSTRRFQIIRYFN